MKREVFLSLLVAEMDDLLEDIRLIEERYKAQFESLKISNYVYLENNALLEKERHCVQLLREHLSELKPESFATVDEIARSILDAARERVRQYEYPEAVCLFIERKINKVMAYVDEAR